MKQSLPAGAIGFSRPAKGLGGIVGRIIATRQGLLWSAPVMPGHEKVGAISHVRVALGDGTIWESTFPKSKITRESETTGVIWYAPRPSLTQAAAVRLRLAALKRLGVRYSLMALIRFLITGTLGKDKDFVCTTGAATLLHEATDRDVSGCGQPWNVELRTWFAYIAGARWWPV